MAEIEKSKVGIKPGLAATRARETLLRSGQAAALRWGAGTFDWTDVPGVPVESEA